MTDREDELVEMMRVIIMKMDYLTNRVLSLETEIINFKGAVTQASIGMKELRDTPIGEVEQQEHDNHD